LTACIASILELNIEEVPRFHNDTWWVELRKFLYEKGYTAKLLKITDRYPQEFYILNGRSIRGRLHSVVAFGKDIVHDPHPDKTGLEVREDLIVITRS
jgi:hypothetical protein